LNLKTQQFKVFTHNPKNQNSIPNNNIREIIHLDDTIYIATQNSIGIFDLKTETCNTLWFKDVDFLNREIPDVFIDSKRRLWFSASNNVCSYDLNKKKVE
jgi:hypothetical protein